MNTFRVLLVDDGLQEVTCATSWLHQGADVLPARPEVIPAGSVSEAAAVLKDCLRSDRAIDAAIVDLGLGPRQPSGLGAIDLLEKARVPIAVWTDWREGARRLMFVYAAFSWYKPAALLPKARFTSGTDTDRAGHDFARDIMRVHRGEAVHPDLAAYFRPRQGREWPFTNVLSSEKDLRKWQAFVMFSQTKEVAAHLGLQQKSIDNWLVEKYEPVWRLLDHASTHMEVDDADIADPRDRLAPQNGDHKQANLDRKAALHQFARSQSWFFNDPVVSARFFGAASRKRQTVTASRPGGHVRLQFRGVAAALRRRGSAGVEPNRGLGSDVPPRARA